MLGGGGLASYAVPVAGAVVYYSQLAPSPAVSWCGMQLRKGQGHLLSTRRIEMEQNKVWKLTLLHRPFVYRQGLGAAGAAMTVANSHHSVTTTNLTLCS